MGWHILTPEENANRANEARAKTAAATQAEADRKAALQKMENPDTARPTYGNAANASTYTAPTATAAPGVQVQNIDEQVGKYGTLYDQSMNPANAAASRSLADTLAARGLSNDSASAREFTQLAAAQNAARSGAVGGFLKDTSLQTQELGARAGMQTQQLQTDVSKSNADRQSEADRQAEDIQARYGLSDDETRRVSAQIMSNEKQTSDKIAAEKKIAADNLALEKKKYNSRIGDMFINAGANALTGLLTG